MYKEIWTIGRILRWTEQYFQSKETDTPRLDGEVLLSHVLGKDRVYLYTHYDQPLIRKELDLYRHYVTARGKGKSVAAIVGEKEFMGLAFTVTDDVLIPRPDTETLVEYVLTRYDKGQSLRILDVCSGPGTILLSLLHYLPSARGVGIELSDPALSAAEENRRKFGLEERGIFYKSDMFSRFRNEENHPLFDVLVSNPPYITERDMALLPPEVRAEPPMALYGGVDGLDFYRILAAEGGRFLCPRGLVALEVGYDQSGAVQDLLRKSGDFQDIESVSDLAGIERVVTARRKGDTDGCTDFKESR